MSDSSTLVSLAGVAELPLPRTGARPRFLTAVALALLVSADDDGVIEDARRAIADKIDGAPRWPDRSEARRLRQSVVLPELRSLKRTITQRATRNGAVDPLAYMTLGGPGVDRRLYAEQLPPVLANVSRCLSILERHGLVERWYRNLATGIDHARPFKGAVVCVRLTGPLYDFWAARRR